MELLAQARPNGRIIDHFRVALGGSGVLDVSIPMKRLLLVPASLGWRLKFQVRPRDITLRRNMATSEWSDVIGLIRAGDSTVENAAEEVIDNKVVMAEMTKAKRRLRPLRRLHQRGPPHVAPTPGPAFIFGCSNRQASSPRVSQFFLNYKFILMK
jgi:hypothetical protein